MARNDGGKKQIRCWRRTAMVSEPLLASDACMGQLNDGRPIERMRDDGVECGKELTLSCS